MKPSVEKLGFALAVVLIALCTAVIWSRRAPSVPGTDRSTRAPGQDPTNVTIEPRPSPARPAFPSAARSIPPFESELDRREREFYSQYPLALKARDYQDTESPSAEMEVVLERVKAYADEPSDVPTKNLRNGNLNIILEMETPLMIKEHLETDSDLGQMLRVGFKASQWDWPHLLRNLDSRIGSSEPDTTIVETVDQLLAAIHKREQRILDYSREKQEEAEMPDLIREDIRQLALEALTRGVNKAYLETITPPELAEARRRVAREAKESSHR